MHPLWKGTLNFGLVSIPVALYPGDRPRETDLDFTLLDRRDMAPVGYQKINKRTRRPVQKEDVVKGFEYDEDEYVVVDAEDFERVSPESTRRVDIASFVDLDAIAPAYFDRPYYLEPSAKSDKAYALLRSALERTRKAGLASVVIRARAHLSAVVSHGPLLTLNTLRYHQELRDPGELKLPVGDRRRLRISDAELRMAQRLIEDMTGPWLPERYRDEYRDQLLDFIKRKAAAGRVEEAAPPERRPRRHEPPEDIMSLLKESVAQAEVGARGGRGRPAYRH